ncbi:MAG: ABC transporter ATP-binding protein [Planctomycetota bacterium]
MAEPCIVAQGLGRAFGQKWAVRGLDLAIGEGELYGFLGPNGAGKTTTMRMLTGMLRPSEGAVRLCGLDPALDAAAQKRITGFVPDTPPLYDYLTGRQYVALVASLWRVGRRERDERMARLVHTLGLDDVLDELCRGYSHGTRKKIHTAAVLCTAPRVLLLDEPTTGLDPRSARALKDLLRDEARGGTTILFSTHVLDAAEQICDRVGILAHGRLQAEGTIQELRAQRGDGSLEDIFLRLTGAAADGSSESGSAETDAGTGDAPVRG